MPAYSGLYDGVFGEPYAPIASPNPPLAGGIVRVLLQKRGLYGYASALGGDVPATRKTVDADRNDMSMRGGWDYATRADDPANRVTVTNIGGDVNTLEDTAVVADPSATEIAQVADITRNHAYPPDLAQSGATSFELEGNP